MRRINQVRKCCLFMPYFRQYVYGRNTRISNLICLKESWRFYSHFAKDSPKYCCAFYLYIWIPWWTLWFDPIPDDYRWRWLTGFTQLSKWINFKYWKNPKFDISVPSYQLEDESENSITKSIDLSWSWRLSKFLATGTTFS